MQCCRICGLSCRMVGMSTAESLAEYVHPDLKESADKVRREENVKTSFA